MKTEILVNKNPLFDKCPSCNKLGTLHRSKSRNTWERIVKNFTFFKIYRCKECGWRGYRSTLTITWASVKLLAFYIAVAVFVGLLVRVIISRFLA